MMARLSRLINDPLKDDKKNAFINILPVSKSIDELNISR